MLPEPGKTYVRRLSARGVGRDAHAARARLARVLSSADLHPAGLSAETIICVRRLQDPLPGVLQRACRGGSQRIAPEWEKEARAAVESVARRAARPAREIVPADACAVVFADRAELLACLAADGCERVAHARWWWQSILPRGADAGAALVREMLDAPAYLPAALAHLAHVHKAEKFVRALDAHDARALLVSVAHAFSLTLPRTALDGAADEGAETSGVGHVSPNTDDALARQRAVASPSPTRAPWLAHVPECGGERLRPEQEALLGVGLMLVRAPAVARTHAFARSASDWLRHAARRDDDGAARAPDMIGVDSTRRRVSPDDLSVGTSEALFIETKAHGANTSSADGVTEASPPGLVSEAPSRAAETRAGVAAGSHESRASGLDTLPLEPEGFDGSPRAREVERAGGELHADASAPETRERGVEPAPFAPLLFEERVETKLGGIFYLVNVALALELYGDFTKPAAPGLPLVIWDFLALVGQELARDKFADDAIGPLLARLAGRGEGKEPGAGFEPPDEWRVPGAWLAPFAATGACLWSAQGARLRVRHPAGFLLLDLPLDTRDTRAQLAREWEAYRSCEGFSLRETASRDWPRAARASAGIERWLGWLMPYVRARLCRALGLDGAAEAVTLTCEHAARVHARAARVDVFFSLAALPLAVRLAGLDRDPGWVPSAGKFIAFHYE